MKLDNHLMKHIDLVVEQCPKLETVKQNVINADLLMEGCYEHDGKLLIARNGGSVADLEHIARELLKRFRTSRPVPLELAEKLKPKILTNYT